MSAEALCKHNQTGHCKYKFGCRKTHENELCPEEDKCTSNKCLFRHPKTCKYFFRDGVCRYGEGCSYAHKRVCNKDQKVKEITEKHEQEVNTMKDEINKPKEHISVMEDKIIELNQDIQSSNKFNIGEIVGLVVSLLDKHKSSENSSTPENKSNSLEHCDICDFESENKKVMKYHITEEHEDCYCCYLCDKYFETKENMKYHNEFIHNHHYTMSESEGEDNQVQPNAVTQEQKKHKKKKKGGKK